MARTTERVLVRTAGTLIAVAVGVLFALASTAAADVADPSSESYTPYLPSQPATQTKWAPDSGSAAPGSSPPPAAPVEEPDLSGEAAAPPAEEPAAADPVPDGGPATEPVTLAESLADVDRREAPTTPVPETIVTRSVRSAPPTEVSESAASDGPLVRVVRSAANTLTDLRVSLAEAASACQVAVGSGAGGPVLVFAILGTFAALTGRRALEARWVADEEVPEMLYAWEVIAPG